MTEYDCPHCGQDLRLPPDAYEQLEEKQHYARQLGIANTRLKKLEAWRIEAEGLITQLESTISGYEAVMKAKEKLRE